MGAENIVSGLMATDVNGYILAASIPTYIKHKQAVMKRKYKVA